MRNILIKIVVAVIVLAIAITSIVIYKSQQEPAAEISGTVTIELVPLSGESVTKQLEYQTGDTLFGLLTENFEVTYEEGQFGILLYGVDQIQTDFINTYVALYVNGTYSNYGISSISLEDGAVYSFREAKI